MRISFICKVTRDHKAVTAANDTGLYSTIFVVFLGFLPGGPGSNFPYEQTTKLIPLAEPARLKRPLVCIKFSFLRRGKSGHVNSLPSLLLDKLFLTNHVAC